MKETGEAPSISLNDRGEQPQPTEMVECARRDHIAMHHRTENPGGGSSPRDANLQFDPFQLAKAAWYLMAEGTDYDPARMFGQPNNKMKT